MSVQINIKLFSKTKLIFKIEIYAKIFGRGEPTHTQKFD